MQDDADDKLRRELLRIALLLSTTKAETRQKDLVRMLGEDDSYQSRISKLLSELSTDEGSKDNKLHKRVVEVTGGTLPWLFTEFREDRLTCDLKVMLDGIRKEHDLAPKLMKWVGGDEAAVPEVRVFDCGPVEREGEKPEEAKKRRLDQFGRLAAGYVKDLFPRMGLLTAVCWGKTLKGLSNGLRGYKIGELNPRPDFIPAVGEPLAPDLEVTATKLAAEFRKIVGHDDSGNKSLSAVPTSIPSRFKEHAPLLRSYFLWQKHYQAIFPMRQDDQEFITENNLEAPWKRKGRPLIELVESVLSSVGTPEDSDEWVNEVARMAGLEIEHLKQMTIGNIGGYFFHKPGLGKKDAKQLDEVNDLWTGITRDHLVEVAHQSRKKGRAGIVILAVGAVKAPIIKACIEHDPCLVQHLIISNDLAAELAKL